MIIRLFPEEKVFKGKKVKENEKLVLELVTFPSYTATKKKKKKSGFSLRGNCIWPSRSG